MRRLFPPPVIALITAIGMWWLSPHRHYNAPLLLILLLFAIAAAIAFAALWQCHQHRTTINPQQLNGTTALITGGIFRFSRNPMYLSLLLVLIAYALWLGSFMCWLGVIAFVVIMNCTQIKREEQFLSEKFGEAYRIYREQVRRWI